MRGRISIKKAAVWVITLLFILYAVIILYPLIWMFLSGLKTDNELFTSPWSLAAHPSVENFVKVWKACIGGNFLNSLFFTAVGSGLVILIAGFAAYAVSRFEFKLKHIVFMIIISGLMLAPQTSLIPLYKILNYTHLYDTRLGLLLPYVAYRIPFSFFLMWSFFIALPKDMEEAAFIDGASLYRTYFRIILPMSKPVVATTFIMSARYIWNDFMFALVFTESDAIKTIPVGLFALKSSSRTAWTELLAGLALSALPIIIAYIFLQKYFVNGLNEGAVKG